MKSSIWDVEESMSKKSAVNYDSKSDVLYIVAKKGNEEESIEIVPGVNVKLDDKGEVVGIEIFNASKFFKPIAKNLYQHMRIA